MVVGGFLGFSGCTENFEEINSNPYTISQEELQADFQHIGGPFSQAQQNIYTYSPAWVTQLQQNLIGDVYSGYMMPPTPFASNSNNMTYNLVDGWNGFPWSTAYSNVMSAMGAVDVAAGDEGEFDDFKAWAQIIRVEAMHRVSDIYGPIIYRNFGDAGALFESQESVYNAFFEDLESAVSTLTSLIAEEPRPFTAFDLVYGGDYESWVRFANSLRLRLAIRISKVNPALAKQQGEAALSHSVGLLESGQDFLVTSASGATHPLNVINGSWHDVRMGAEMESILEGYSDPRIGSYFETAVEFTGDYVGIRQGIDIVSKSDYENYSALTTFDKVQLMTASEVYFLRAEAALRGWANAGETAKDLYETAVQTSFDQHGIGSAATYLADNASSANPYVDPKNDDNNVDVGSPYLSTITIAYDAADPFETSLERIITQKWIAMYPDGQEAWSEYRRTGYPILFPVVLNFSGGAISTEDHIKRINFSTTEKDTNPVGYAAGVSALGGPDNGGTSLWWDVD